MVYPYIIPELLIKAEKVIQSCQTVEHLIQAAQYKELVRKELTEEEECGLHGYFRAKAHSMGFIVNITKTRPHE